MRGFFEVMKDSQQPGEETIRFSVSLTVNSKDMREYYNEPTSTVEKLLQGEIDSWLSDLPFVNAIDVRRKW